MTNPPKWAKLSIPGAIKPNNKLIPRITIKLDIIPVLLNIVFFQPKTMIAPSKPKIAPEAPADRYGL